MLSHHSQLDRCLELARHGRYEDAADLAGVAVLDEPSDGQLWQLCGLLRHKLGRMPGALEALETASALVPLAPASRCALAECYARSGHDGLACEIYCALSRDRACPTDLLPNIASGLGSMGEDEEALNTCLELLRRDPNYHQAHYGVAFYLRRMGRPPRAMLPMVARAHEIAPEVALYRITLACLHHDLGNGREAYDLLRDVDPSAYHCRCCVERAAKIFRNHGDDERAAALEDLA
ncbi:tetratricopeptide repeat protein [Tundrisphaera sp. TA3]|uniref:tetratricopeptide repeat protein n=1 Tax=Tundrisphaera sp. TA3 TaxID=3435775 RepID=UPI003EC00554